MIWCPVLLRCHSNGSVIFVPRTKEGHFVKHCYLPCSLSLFPSLLLCQVEIKMKKTDAIRWEKLEGEGQESNIKHFNPRQCTALALTHPSPLRLSFCRRSHHSPFLPRPLLISLPFSLSFSLSTKININACVCLFGTKMRVGSQALLESFISLTAKVGRERERYDSKIWLSILAHTFLLLTGLITYVSVCVCVLRRWSKS